MPKYNIDALGPQKFEELSQALVQKIIGPGAKVYGMGSDGAREATFQGKAPYPSTEEQWEGDWIFQSKFHDIIQIGPQEARKALLPDLDSELTKITEKFKHKCDNYILITNVILTPVFQKGIKDKIDNEIIPKYRHKIKNIHVWGADEICRFLDNNSDIRTAYQEFLLTGDIIASLLGLIKQKEKDLEEIVQLYCQGCFDHEHSAVLDDAGDIEDKPVPLQEVFIDLSVKPPLLPKDTLILDRIPKWLQQAALDEDRISALSYLLDDSIPNLNLIGGPGEGKSTLGQFIAQIYRARLIGKFNELGGDIKDYEKCIPRIPFRILLKEYAQWISSHESNDNLFYYLQDHVSHNSGRKISSGDIQNIIKNNPTLLILDGLDEVSKPSLRTKVITNILSFINQVRDVLKGNLRIIATTRPYGYSQEFDPYHCLHLVLQKLISDKAIKYANKWITVRETDPKQKERILTTLYSCIEDPVVNVLTHTPLQVTILLVIIRARGTPPKQREELFERYMDIIYQREQKKLPELLSTEKDIIYGLHKYLAYILHMRAAKDKTAALMDIDDFKKTVKEYLLNNNPLLNDDELNTKTDQIITEASQRLILIESPEEGKVGFGLTSIREFFTAAHLVDSAKDTKERDERFKAIATSPHWRNVALFFAGRVGRTIPGEAPSMIDVCREIDTGKVDKYLKRGAELVFDMVNDRVLRETHNEMSAIQYGLTILDRGFIKDANKFNILLNNLGIQYKERLIRLWMEERIKSVKAENLIYYIDYYQNQFGNTQHFSDAIKRAGESKSTEVKLWALLMALKNGVQKKWVLTLFEYLVKNIPTNKIAETISNTWRNFKLYLDSDISSEIIYTCANSLILGIAKENRLYRPLPNGVLEELNKFAPKGNSYVLWGIAQLMIINHIYNISTIERKEDRTYSIHLPGIIIPEIKNYINNNINEIKYFCETYKNENNDLIKLLVAVYSYLLEPSNCGKYISINNVTKGSDNILNIPLPIFIFTKNDELIQYHKEFYNLYAYYQSQEKYSEDIEELHNIINKNSKTILNHPQIFHIWIKYNCNPSVEKYLDSDVLSELKNWLIKRGFSEIIFWKSGYTIRIIRNDEFIEYVFKIMKKLLEENNQLIVLWPLEINQLRSKKKLVISRLIKHIFENVLEKYNSIDDSNKQKLEYIYWTALRADIVEERHLISLYKIVSKDPQFPSLTWHANETKNAIPFLESMLNNKDFEVARIAAVSLSFVSKKEQQSLSRIRKIDKLWELSKYKNDIWRTRYIETMANYKLPWAKRKNEWYTAIKKANSEEDQQAWCKVIKSASYDKQKDKQALFDLILQILENEEQFTKPIRFAAIQRLSELIGEIEETTIDETMLNLPLPKRIKLSYQLR
jgi:hypothetical protein